MPPPPILAPLGTFECFFIFNIYQHYLEAIPSKSYVSIIISSKMLVSFAILAKNSRWKGSNISRPYISNFSYLIILLYFYHPHITL